VKLVQRPCPDCDGNGAEHTRFSQWPCPSGRWDWKCHHLCPRCDGSGQIAIRIFEPQQQQITREHIRLREMDES
jgi:DnaJ-class molecular chaperone